MKPIILIPARMAATRLPGKPLADINGIPMIVRVWRQGMAAKLGPVVVAAGDQEIVDEVKKHGGEAILTDPRLPSGSDRIWAALKALPDGGAYDAVINLQGDLPAVDPELLQQVAAPLKDKNIDIATPATVIKNKEEAENPNIVKIAMNEGGGRALYFSRSVIPHGDGPLYHHIGIYAYQRNALEKFINLPVGYLEKREKLEQLRALENGMRIEVVLTDTAPLTVDTPEDLSRAREALR
ncbi:MAG: 3-deoxy-manno-octulosonate cytidylyltransferase [Dongiaceae bacterium]